MARTTVKATKSAPKISHAPLSHGIGRRKSSVARVWVYRGGTGKLTINGKDFKDYFDTQVARLEASLPLQVAQSASNYQFEVNVVGGGQEGQAGAIKLGIARALVEADDSLKGLFRQHGLLTVDARVKERKKYGQKAARRKFQFVKR